MKIKEEKSEKVIDLISGMKAYEWAQIKQKVDMLYSSRAAKVEFDDSEALRRNLKSGV
ncbi:hypothetical protein [Shouchella hunanensis]|uniref:Uncharacterized protein n=1 Tax=Shouchella hunanensis TaxID=766894 RepID=A0ABY7W1V8_9BACI|nr:hypothetical protein [Shouchella hunanensis]WDF02927.1 hypothetical protein PQ477_15685 [Shouchella hunanensis]